MYAMIDTRYMIVYWFYYYENYVLYVILTLEIYWLIVQCIILSFYYSSIHVISYLVYFYGSIIVYSHVIYTCIFPYFSHSLRVFWLPKICKTRSMYILFYWSGILRGSHVLRGARSFPLFDRPVAVFLLL